jgi:DNA-binding winged helix-turn-helix (wHTH) protein
MTQWRVGRFEFDANTRRLRGDDGDVLLEPKTAALLAYFCQHPQRDIDRDELLKNVWHGQVVADNSINRVVVLLRKALQDDDKARRYIATVPKLGYRMIAQVAAHPVEGSEPIDRESTSRARLIRYLAGVAAVGLAVSVLVWALRPEPDITSTAPSVRPLSRLAVAQSSADLARDGETLLYTASDGERNVIFQIAGPFAEPVPVSAPDGSADFAKWSYGEDFIVYQFRTQNRCEFHRVNRSELQARTASVLYECAPGSYSELSLSPDDGTLYFVERDSATSPYAVYALDLAGKTKRRLSQPVARGYGNHYVDVHPRSGALLLLSDHAPGKTSIYKLDVASNSFVLHRRLDYSLDSAIWSHRDGFVVHPSRHPSYQLLETSLDEGVSSVIVSDSRRISGPRRIINADGAGSDYLFTSYLYNRDIEMQEYPAARFNSAVMDYLPAISHARHQLAFISKRSGDSQIWIRDFRDGSLRSIEPPDTGRRFLDLRWSPNDGRLLANTNSGILIYSMREEAFVHIVSLPLPAHAVRWHDARTLSFSHFEDRRWQAYLYSLDTEEAITLDERWAFSARNDQQQIYLDQSLATYRDGEVLEELERCAHPVWRAQLRYQLDGADIYCHAGDVSSDLLRFGPDMSMSRVEDAVERYEFFSVRHGQIASTRVVSAYSDIMRTRRPD